MLRDDAVCRLHSTQHCFTQQADGIHLGKNNTFGPEVSLLIQRSVMQASQPSSYGAASAIPAEFASALQWQVNLVELLPMTYLLYVAAGAVRGMIRYLKRFRR